MAVIAKKGKRTAQPKPRKPKGKTLSVILPQDVYAQLEAESIAEERSMGWIVREALAAYFAETT